MGILTVTFLSEWAIANMIFSRRLQHANILFSLCLLLAVTPLLLLHLVNLWKYRPHYEFIPLFLIGTIYLAWTRTPSIQSAVHTWWSRLLSGVLLATGFVVLSAATLLFSPWLGAIAAVLTLGGLAIVGTGTEGIRQLGAVWLLLWLIIPPPFRLDDTLIQMLQSVTAQGGSWLAELFSVPHLLAGNLIRLPERDLFLAEACSGINSQLVVVAAAALAVVMLHRSWLHALLLIASSLLWSSATNILRVGMVVAAGHHLDVDLATGALHELLGIGTVLVGLALILSTDQLLMAFFSPVLSARAENSFARDPLSYLWNQFLASHEWEHIPLDEDDVQTHVRQESPTENTVPQRPALAGLGLCKSALACGFLCVGGSSFACMILTTPEIRLHTAALAETTRQDWLPSAFQDWRLVKFREIERESSSDEGQHSQIWNYSGEQGDCQVSVDYPFLGWHEVTRCYRAHGWVVTGRTVHHDADKQGKQWSIVEVQMEKPTGDTASLFFSMVDTAGYPVTPRSKHWSGIHGKLAHSPLASLLRGENTRSVATTVQIQLLVISSGPTNITQQRNFFRQVRDRLYRQWFTKDQQQIAGR